VVALLLLRSHLLPFRFLAFLRTKAIWFVEIIESIRVIGISEGNSKPRIPQIHPSILETCSREPLFPVAISPQNILFEVLGIYLVGLLQGDPIKSDC
jgi:hypothetical protein